MKFVEKLLPDGSEKVIMTDQIGDAGLVQPSNRTRPPLAQVTHDRDRVPKETDGLLDVRGEMLGGLGVHAARPQHPAGRNRIPETNRAKALPCDEASLVANGQRTINPLRGPEFEVLLN